MLILALDTATDKGTLALLTAGRLLGELSLESQGTYLQHLLPGLQDLLAAAGRRLEEVNAIAVTQGPGNFTGLRIGLATAKTLAWALGCPLVPVPTLEVLAAQVAFQERPIAVLLDAKRQEVYLGLFRCPETLPEALAPPRRLPLAALPGCLQAPLLLTGPGLDTYAEFLREHLAPDLCWAPAELRQLRASTLARLAACRLQQGRTASPQQLVPDYLRPAL